MAWNGNFRPYVSRPRDPLSFLYDCESFPGMEIKCLDRPPQPIVTTSNSNDNNDYRRTSGAQERKRRLRTDQIESLEKSFQEEIKLEPDRKMKLAQELNLEPRQVAVWFQNRRARWKAKQLERLYDALKEEFDAISREKHKLQEEVIKLRAELEDRTTKQGSTNYTEASAEETVDSTVVVRSSFKLQNNSYQQIAGCSYLFNVEDCNPPSPPYWGAWPGGCA